MATTNGFRMELKPVFLFVYLAGAVVGTTMIVLWRMLDPGLQSVPYAVILDTIGYYLILVAPFYAGLSALVMSYYFKYEISESGIGGRKLHGRLTLREMGLYR